MGRTQQIPSRKSEYRKIERLSYSSLALFNRDRKLFYKKIILGETVEEDNPSILRGNIVDILLTSPEEFDSHFIITKAVHPPPQMKTFCELLFKIRTTNVDWDMKECSELAYKELSDLNAPKKLSTGYEKYLENFLNGEGAPYLQELLDCNGRQLISIEDATIANSIVAKSKKCEAFKMRGNRKLTKVPIMFSVGEFDLKCEVDEIDIDDNGKVIYPLDDKVTAFSDFFPIKGFLGSFYYIQAGLYRFAIDSVWKHEQGLSDYKTEGMAFKVMDQADWAEPLLYKTTDEHYEQAFTGFYAGKYYKGITQLLEEIKYHTEVDNWNMSVENIKNNGEVYIPSFKQQRDE